MFSEIELKKKEKENIWRRIFSEEKKNQRGEGRKYLKKQKILFVEEKKSEEGKVGKKEENIMEKGKLLRTGRVEIKGSSQT